MVVWSEKRNKGQTKGRPRRGSEEQGVCMIPTGEISILIESASFGRLFSSAERRICVCIYVSICSLQKLTELRASSSC